MGPAPARVRAEAAHQDEVGLGRVRAEARAVERGGGEAGEQAPGAGGEDVGVPVGPRGVRVRAPGRGEDGDPRRQRDREGEVRLSALFSKFTL